MYPKNCLSLKKIKPIQIQQKQYFLYFIQKHKSNKHNCFLHPFSPTHTIKSTTVFKQEDGHFFWYIPLLKCRYFLNGNTQHFIMKLFSGPQETNVLVSPSSSHTLLEMIGKNCFSYFCQSTFMIHCSSVSPLPKHLVNRTFFN